MPTPEASSLLPRIPIILASRAGGRSRAPSELRRLTSGSLMRTAKERGTRRRFGFGAILCPPYVRHRSVTGGPNEGQVVSSPPLWP